MTAISSGPIPSPGTSGTRSWRNGSSSASLTTCSSWSSVRWSVKAEAAAIALPSFPPTCVPAASADSKGSRADPGTVGMHPFTMSGPRVTADLVLELVGGLDRLVHRHLLREGDEGDLGARRIGQQLGHVRSLSSERSRPGGVEEAARRGEKGHHMPRGRSVDENEVGGSPTLELLHLSENEDVSDPGYRRGDDVEGSG